MSSMLKLKKLANLNANTIDGLYLPFSSEPIVCLDTPIAFARSSCLIPFSCRNFSKLFFNLSPLMES